MPCEWQHDLLVVAQPSNNQHHNKQHTSNGTKNNGVEWRDDVTAAAGSSSRRGRFEVPLGGAPKITYIIHFVCTILLVGRVLWVTYFYDVAASVQSSSSTPNAYRLVGRI